ncbi:MAG: NAD-binding protein [Candidatus Omnitrophica bacterium]|nr:NAD-binding protein [Candidatus Omnitrophota bacterium]MDD5574041.1 NAD-binding protein [Candidatus Omnitrophota bacterium]
MYIIVAGAGKVGHFLAQRLLEDKHTVVVIEKNRDVCQKLSQTLNLVIVNGDACEPRFLEEAHIERADVLAAVTGEDEDNLVICQLAKEKFGIRRTVGRVNDPANEHTFNELGVDVPIDATKIIAKIIEEEVSFTDFVNLMSFKRGKLAIVRVDLNDDSPAVHKNLNELVLPPDSVLVSIIRKDEVVVPKGNTTLEPGDDIIALTLVENEQQLLRALIGDLR